MGISSALAATTISFISAHLSKASSVRAITGIPQSSIVCFVCPLPILVPLPAAAITADVKCGFPAVFDRLRISAAMSPLVICKLIIPYSIIFSPFIIPHPARNVVNKVIILTHPESVVC